MTRLPVINISLTSMPTCSFSEVYIYSTLDHQGRERDPNNFLSKWVMTHECDMTDIMLPEMVYGIAEEMIPVFGSPQGIFKDCVLHEKRLG